MDKTENGLEQVTEELAQCLEQAREFTGWCENIIESEDDLIIQEYDQRVRDFYEKSYNALENYKNNLKTETSTLNTDDNSTMKRPINFRAWFGGKMFYDVLAGVHSMEYIPPGVGEWKRVPIAECVVMQFTGLQDGVGEEIYEGDIVRVGGTSTYEVNFKDGGFWFSNTNYKISLASNKALKSLLALSRVVGNIYEVPEAVLDNQE